MVADGEVVLEAERRKNDSVAHRKRQAQVLAVRFHRHRRLARWHRVDRRRAVSGRRIHGGRGHRWRQVVENRRRHGVNLLQHHQHHHIF